MYISMRMFFVAVASLWCTLTEGKGGARLQPCSVGAANALCDGVMLASGPHQAASSRRDRVTGACVKRAKVCTCFNMCLALSSYIDVHTPILRLHSRLVDTEGVL